MKLNPTQFLGKSLHLLRKKKLNQIKLSLKTKCKPHKSISAKVSLLMNQRKKDLANANHLWVISSNPDPRRSCVPQKQMIILRNWFKSVTLTLNFRSWISRKGKRPNFKCTFRRSRPNNRFVNKSRARSLTFTQIFNWSPKSFLAVFATANTWHPKCSAYSCWTFFQPNPQTLRYLESFCPTL